VSAFIGLYLAWAGPNIRAAIASASTAWWLLSLRRGGGAWRRLEALILIVGFAVLPVVLIATLAALAGIGPLTEPGLLGSLTGVIAATLARDRT
jgi:hypothetical protein